ncbi:glycosyltransferase involved in cell wall biosynthesis/uncharacterized coiled-coil protein SlyX [Variovorax sp. OAS795]|uniref:rhamnan synthesis F family protein n=1 Tax=Variovorax sp. OAS795 TaxID=3034231 RepID=UPI003394F07A
MPKITVLLTSFNHAKYIGKAIDSVLGQTFSDFELLILDDGSTDDSWWLINQYADPRIKSFRSSMPGEVVWRTNDIISNVAQGELIAIHHSDDVWELDKLQKQIAVLDQAPEVCAVFTNARAITEEGTPLADEKHFYATIFDQPNRSRHEWLRYFFNHGNALCHPSALIRKSAFAECGLYRLWLRQIDDFEMWVRFAMKHEIHVIPEKLTLFRVRSTELQVSGNYREARIRNAYEIFHLLDDYREISSFDDLYAIFPEARKHHRIDGADLGFVLGLIMLEVATRPFVKLFALELLHEAVTDPVRAENIRAVYGFDATDLIRFTGDHDVFSLEEAATLREALRKQEASNHQLQIDALSSSEKIANFDRGVAERDGLILDLDAKLTASGSTVASLAQQLQERDGDLASRNDQIKELTEALEEIDARFAEAGKAIAAFDAQAVAQDRKIGSLVAQVAEKDQAIGSLETQMAEKEQRIGSLAAQVAEKTLWIGSLEAQLAEKARWINGLDAQLAEKARWIDGLDARMAEKNRQIDALSLQLDASHRQAAQQGEDSASLQRELAQRGVEVNALVTSRSWKVTRPLRLVGKMVQRVRRQHAQPEAHSAAPAMPAMAEIPAVISASPEPTPSPAAPVLPPQEEFDPAFYLESNPDVAEAGVDPYLHFVTCGAAEGRLGTRPERIEIAPGQAPETDAPDCAAEAEASVAPEDEPMLVADPDFDEAYYLHRYPDILGAGIPAYQHFILHGRAEGRIGKRPELTIRPGAHAADPERRSVLVVSHEASRTGAPILSLNIAAELQKRFNVVVMLLGGGDLIPDFCDAASLVAGPELVRGAPEEADFAVAQLCSRVDFEFAIVNSIESRVVLRGLARSSIPTVNLIHEFAAYTRPRDAFPFAMHWAGETVFSTRITYENALSELPALAHSNAHILPQGRCVPPDIEIDPGKRAAETARVKSFLRPDSPEGRNSFVVIGAGSVQYRKGVDLFMECAARVIRSPGGEACRFVWIGNGYDPEKDIGYSSYLAEQVRRAGLGQQFAFMPETPLIDHAYALADTMLLSSRLDPLPNVAIDAMSCGLPLVCFSGASGIADILEQNDLAEPCVAPYHDTAAMAELVLKLARSPEATRDLGARMKRVADEQFNMVAYIGKLEELASSAGQQLAREHESSRIIAKSELLDPEFFLRSPQDNNKTLDDIVRHDYVRSWATGIDKRKPLPGFHPGIYRERQEPGTHDLDPFAAYLQAGQPDGPWKFELIRSEDPGTAALGDLRAALHLHVYYPELLPEILQRLEKNRLRPDLFISVPNEGVMESVRTYALGYTGNVVRLRVVPNVGRDLGPLLTAFGGELVKDYDIVGHVHTKKSVDIADASTGSTWHRFLMENLLGGKAPMIDIIMGRMAADPSIGLVFPDDPHIVDWGANRQHAEMLAARLGLGELPLHPVFPVGSMFWARADAIRPLVNLNLDWQDYPPEPLPYDGSMLHAIERLLPSVAKARSTRVVLTHVDGITR